MLFVFFFFNDTATTEIYTLSLHDALPICEEVWRIMNEITKQFLLEVARVAVLAVIPVALAYLQIIDASYAIYIVVILRGLDRALHETISKKAIVRFWIYDTNNHREAHGDNIPYGSFHCGFSYYKEGLLFQIIYNWFYLAVSLAEKRTFILKPFTVVAFFT